MTIIEYQLTAMNDVGIRDIAVVTGYHAEELRKIRWPRISFVHNPYFKHTNSLASLSYAKEAIKGGAIILNSDVLFHKRILKELVDTDAEYALAVEFKRCDEEDMKVRAHNGVLLEISKQINLDRADGEFIGLAKVSAKGADMLVQTMSDLLEEGGYNLFFDLIFQRLADLGCRVEVMDIGSAPWIEIDYPQDFDNAKEIFPRLV